MSQITGVSIVCSTVCPGADHINIKALRHWSLWGETTVTGGFPPHMASYAENVSIRWHLHAEWYMKRQSYTMVMSDCWLHFKYRQLSNIRRAKSENLNVSRLVLQLSLSSPLKLGVKSRIKMQLEQRRQAMVKTYIRDLTVVKSIILWETIFNSRWTIKRFIHLTIYACMCERYDIDWYIVQRCTHIA